MGESTISEQKLLLIKESVLRQMNAGHSNESIVSTVQDRGVGYNEAKILVDSLRSEFEQSKPVRTSLQVTQPLLKPFVASIFVGLVGAVVWLLLFMFTGYELGFIAWGIGLTCGTIACEFSERPKQASIRWIGVFSSILGVFLGKLFSFIYQVNNESGINNVALIDDVREFFNFYAINADIFDLLWITIALATAWRLPDVYRTHTKSYWMQ